MSTRSPVLAGSPLTSGGLTPRRCYSGSPALAIVPATIAGHNRAMIEHATGRAIHPDQPTIAPPNSRNLIGEDHSGALFGRALRHTFATLSWFEFWDPSEIFGGRPPRIDAGGIYGHDENYQIAVPGCHVGGAYESITVRALAEVRTAAASTEVRLRITGETGSVTGYDIDLDASSTGFLSGVVTVPMIPGRYNAINLCFYRVGSGSIAADLLAVFFSVTT